MKEVFIDRIEFGQGNDPRVILVGTGLPFRFGKIERLQITGSEENPNRLTLVVSRDTLTEAAVEAPEERSFFSFLWSLVR